MKTFIQTHIKTILIGLLMIAGLSLLVYPLVASTWNDHVQSTIVNDYNKAVSKQIETGTLDVNTELEKAYDYNANLLPAKLPDSFAAAEANGTDAVYQSILNLNGDGVMGYVQIPCINVKIPIFHTCDEDVLQKGAGHLEGSSLPVGGANTHSVLSAHRGLPSSTLFTDLDKVEVGDVFYIIVMDEYLAYEVDEILVTEPEDTKALEVEDGADECTLITCTPYGVNTQRLMVTGHRVDFNPDILAEAETPAFGAVSVRTNYLLWVVVGLAVVGTFIGCLAIYDKSKSKRDKK